MSIFTSFRCQVKWCEGAVHLHSLENSVEVCEMVVMVVVMVGGGGVELHIKLDTWSVTWSVTTCRKGQWVGQKTLTNKF